MLEIYVCVGSSCHLKGSYQIIQLFESAINAHHLTEQVSLRATFCLGQCANGVTIKIGDELITGVSTQNFDEVFQHYVLSA